MSDFNPSPGAVQQAGNAVLNLIDTYAGKLYDTEAFTQYNHGSQLYRQATTQFLEQIQTDPDYSKYQEKTERFKQQIAAQVSPLITNPQARQKLDAWWMESSDQIDREVGQRRIKAWGDDLTATANKDTETILNDVAAGKITSEAGMANIQRTWNPLIANNLVNRDTYEKQALAWKYETRLDEVTHGAYAAMKGTGGDPNYDKLVTFLSDPENTRGLGAQEVDQIRSKGESYYKSWMLESNKQAKNNNDKNQDDVMDALTAGDVEKARSIVRNGKWLDMKGGESGATVRHTTLDWIDQHVSHQLAGERAPNFENPLFKSMMTRAVAEGSDPGPVLKDARALAAQGKIPYEGEYSLKSIEAVLDKKVQDKAAPVMEAFFKDITAQVSNIKGDQKEAVRLALAYQGAKYHQWVSSHMDASNDEMMAEGERRHKLAIQGIVAEAAKNLPYSEHNTPLAQPVPPVPAGGHPPDKAPEIPPVSAFTKDNGYKQTVGGVSYRIAKDAKGQIVRQKWDGKAWQTVQ